ncbi:hypothetical protein, partial [Hoeflea sp. BAL378]|uniref:hypothetical protein n=1 Tax=Hoeflea sp. BAL378 TaxID=1547437 RepID=UPI001AEBD8AC
NSSIGLIVLIDQCSSNKFDDLFCPDAVAIFDRCAPDGPRHEARRPLGLAELALRVRNQNKDVFKTSKG